MRKRVLGHMRTVMAQISLRIREVWSGHYLSTNGITGYCWMYHRKQKPGWFFAYAHDDLNLRILRMFEGTFALDAAHITIVWNHLPKFQPIRSHGWLLNSLSLFRSQKWREVHSNQVPSTGRITVKQNNYKSLEVTSKQVKWGWMHFQRGGGGGTSSFSILFWKGLYSKRKEFPRICRSLFRRELMYMKAKRKSRNLCPF